MRAPSRLSLGLKYNKTSLCKVSFWSTIGTHFAEWYVWARNVSPFPKFLYQLASGQSNVGLLDLFLEEALRLLFLALLHALFAQQLWHLNRYLMFNSLHLTIFKRLQRIGYRYHKNSIRLIRPVYMYIMLKTKDQISRKGSGNQMITNDGGRGLL